MSVDNKTSKLQNELPAPPALQRSEGNSPPPALPSPAKPKRGRQGQGGGPKTPAGKARSSRNATKHGIFSSLPVIYGMESPDDWERHRQGLFDYHQPQGYGEELLVERLASLSWRMKRAERHKNAVVADQVYDRGPGLLLEEAYARALEVDAFADATGEGEDDDDDDDSAKNRALREVHHSILREASLIPRDHALESSLRYQAHVHRQFMQTLHELEALQNRRNGLPSFLGRFDTMGPPKA